MIRYDVMTARPRALRTADLRSVGRALASALRLRTPAEVAVRFIALKPMATLNRAQLGKNRPTDVLAFPAATLPLPKTGGPKFLGDLAICPPYAQAEAKRRGIESTEELKRLLIHGTLHLMGYDHVREDEEAKMFALQERVLEQVS